MKYDVAWYWAGGADAGAWHECSLESMGDVARGGRVVVRGKRSIGPPEWPPSAHDIEAALRASLPHGFATHECAYGRDVPLSFAIKVF